MSTYCRPAQEHLFISSQGYLSPCCFIKDAKDRLPDIEDPIDWFYNDNAQKNLRDTQRCTISGLVCRRYE